MASEKVWIVWKITHIFFFYMFPIIFIALYDSKTKMISKNTAQKHWSCWFQAFSPYLQLWPEFTHLVLQLRVSQQLKIFKTSGI